MINRVSEQLIVDNKTEYLLKEWAPPLTAFDVTIQEDTTKAVRKSKTGLRNSCDTVRSWSSSNFKEQSKCKIMFFKFLKRFTVLVDLFGWALILLPMAITIGLACGIFLFCLDWVTELRFSYPWIFYLLPLSGIIQALLYKSSIGKNVGAGFDIILEEIYYGKADKNKVFPTRMGPLVFLCTLLTHLCGGSAGREGTGLQIGASISSCWIYILKYITGGKFPKKKDQIDILIIASLGAAFGAIFGTPLSGSVFAMEVLNVGKISTDKLIPTMFCSIMADFVVSQTLILFGISHTVYTVTDSPQAFDYKILGSVIIVGIFCGWCSFLFAFLTKSLKKVIDVISTFIAQIGPKSLKSNKILIGCISASIGGTLIIFIRLIIKTDYYLGIGTIRPSYDKNFIIIKSFFETEDVPYEAFIMKLLFTAITIASGFKGGEVTNLFFMGAALGNVAGQMLGKHYSYFAALGLASVFSGATNTPLSCTLLGYEMFGGNFIVMFGLCSFVSYVVAGWSGVYNKQKIVSIKLLSFFNTKFTRNPKLSTSSLINVTDKLDINIEKVEESS